MSSTSRGLGGRDLATARQQAEQERLIQGVPTSAKLTALLPSPENGRDLDEETADPREWEKVLGLAEAIRSDGVNTALTVVTAETYVKHYPQHEAHVEEHGRPFVVIHGHRRLAAAGVAGLEEVPILLKRDSDVVQIRIAAIQENLLRENLNPVAEAKQYQKALEETGLSQRGLAKRLGNVSQTKISHRLALLNTVPEVQKLVVDDFHEPGSGIKLAFAAKHLARIRPHFQQMFLRKEISPFEAGILSDCLPAVQKRVEEGHLPLEFALGHLGLLSEDLQEKYLRGEIPDADVTELSQTPVKLQQWPLPAGGTSEVIAGQSPAAAERPAETVPIAAPEAPAAGPAADTRVIAGQSPATVEQPAPRPPAAAASPASEVIAGQSPAAADQIAETVSATAPEAPAAGTSVIAGQSPATVEQPAGAAPESAPQEDTSRPAVVLIGTPTAAEIAQALLDNLAPDVIADVLAYLAT